MKRGVLATACLVALAVSAYADPVLNRVESEIVKGRRLSVRVEVTTDGLCGGWQGQRRRHAAEPYGDKSTGGQE